MKLRLYRKVARAYVDNQSMSWCINGRWRLFLSYPRHPINLYQFAHLIVLRTFSSRTLRSRLRSGCQGVQVDQCLTQVHKVQETPFRLSDPKLKAVLRPVVFARHLVINTGDAFLRWLCMPATGCSIRPRPEQPLTVRGVFNKVQRNPINHISTIYFTLALCPAVLPPGQVAPRWHNSRPQPARQHSAHPSEGSCNETQTNLVAARYPSRPWHGGVGTANLGKHLALSIPPLSSPVQPGAGPI